MSSMVTIPCADAESVAREAFWLAWLACGKPMGMGVLQDHPGATKEQVSANVESRGDYPGGTAMLPRKPGELYGDYVFGRMMKLMIGFDDHGVTVRSDAPKPDYQSWCRKYPTYQALIEAAIASLAKPR